MNITKYAVLLRSYYNIWRVFIVMNWEKKKKMQQRQVWRICITWVAGIVKWTHGSSWVQNIDKSSTFFCIVACDTYSISLSMCGVVGECWTQARTESEVNYRRISSSTVLVAPAPSTRNHILQKKKITMKNEIYINKQQQCWAMRQSPVIWRASVISTNKQLFRFNELVMHVHRVQAEHDDRKSSTQHSCKSNNI